MRALLIALLLCTTSCKVVGIRVRNSEAKKEGAAAAEKVAEAYKVDKESEISKLVLQAEEWQSRGRWAYEDMFSWGSEDLDRYEAFISKLNSLNLKTLKPIYSRKTNHALLYLADHKLVDLTEAERAEASQPYRENLEEAVDRVSEAICRHRRGIKDLNAELKKQKAIEAESGVTNLSELRSIGEGLVDHKTALKGYESEFKGYTGKDFDSVNRCNE